ncbi:MAG: lipoyl(octanoyl) transferase LipB [Sulfurimicrobium sp.]|nr:lipoyl(octanoyl) transferase LipB [Sulfurimicrobium sp.]
MLLLTPHPSPITRNLGLVEYLPTWQAMQDFSATRGPETPDELWLLEHPPVYTLGLAGKPEHLLRGTDIPVVKIDRGGQITYHGPGQIVVYLMLDLKRRNIGVKELVRRMEQAVIDLLAGYGVKAERRDKAPGVYIPQGDSDPLRAEARVESYVGNAKIAALGLRIKNGCCYHGLCLNVDMDLSPYAAINPCGYEGLAVTQTRNVGIQDGMQMLGEKLVEYLHKNL